MIGKNAAKRLDEVTRETAMRLLRDEAGRTGDAVQDPMAPVPGARYALNLGFGTKGAVILRMLKRTDHCR